MSDIKHHGTWSINEARHRRWRGYYRAECSLGITETRFITHSLNPRSVWAGKSVSASLEFGEHTALTDGGPDTIVTRKPEAWQLATELGILDDIENPGSETKHIYVLDNGIPIAIPLSPIKFFTSPLLTGRGKLRMLLEPFQRPRRDNEDESLADFVTRRLGREALDKFIGPVLGGIYNTDPEIQSILVSSPIMREMEKNPAACSLPPYNALSAGPGTCQITNQKRVSSVSGAVWPVSLRPCPRS